MRKDSEEIREAQAAASEVFKSKDLVAIGELYAGVIDGTPETLTDVWDEVLGTISMLDGEPQEFEIPTHVIGGRAMVWEFGAKIPRATATKGKLSVAVEHMVTPAYAFDTATIARGNLATVETVKDWAQKSLILAKNIRGIKLFTDGITDTAGGLKVVVKAEDPASDLAPVGDKWKWQVDLKTKLEETVAELQDVTNGESVSAVMRTITKAYVTSCGFDMSSLKIVELNNAVDPDTNQVLFDVGDIILMTKSAGSLGNAMETEASTVASHFSVEYSFRQGHRWVRWSDRGYNTGRIKRVYVINETAATLGLDRFASNGIIIHSDKALDSTTLTSSNVIFSETTGGTAAAGVTMGAVTIDGTMREVQIAASGFTASTNYYVRFTTGVKDIGATAVTAVEFGPYQV